MLLDAQKSNGSWTAGGFGGGVPGGGVTVGDILDTCFAILFLRRATAALKPVALEDKKNK